jgi:hypothetical protein
MAKHKPRPAQVSVTKIGPYNPKKPPGATPKK